MADATSSLFNKKASDKLRNPDDLDKYVRVNNPSTWVVLAACLALLAGLISWGVFGAVTTSVQATGVSVEKQAMCFLSAEDVAKVHVGDIANVGGETMRVKTVAAVPSSRGEAGKTLKSDYLVNTLINGDWAYQVVFDGDTSKLTQDVPLSISITVEHIAPITLIFRNNE